MIPEINTPAREPAQAWKPGLRGQMCPQRKAAGLSSQKGPGNPQRGQKHHLRELQSLVNLQGTGRQGVPFHSKSRMPEDPGPEMCLEINVWPRAG